MAKITFHFDPNQDYQLQAIDSIVDLFDGLGRHEVEFAGADVVPNVDEYESLSENWLLGNLQVVQQRMTAIVQNMLLDVDEGMVLEGVGYESWRYPSFTVEMETGTGKTYVYLRTIYELYRRYGFRKYIIVVPSIAIYEGVIKSFEITRDHFAGLYGNEPVHLVQYDGSRLTGVKEFARSTFVEIMVMTIDSFNKRSNNIYKASEQLPGEWKPYQYIQAVRPILILDEPQSSAASKTAKEALRTLHPLFALRYSATHTEIHNLVYRLTPFEAYRLNLVKKIQVDGVVERDAFAGGLFHLQKIERAKRKGGGSLVAHLKTHVMEHGTAVEQTVVLKQGDDLYAKTRRDEHRHGYVVRNIHAGEGYVEFEAGNLYLDKAPGTTKEDIFRVQIDRTVEWHMKMQQRLLPRRIKVLSLFFIDRVANYVPPNSLIRRLFEEAFERHKPDYPHFAKLEAARVHEGYFAQQGGRGGGQFIDTAGSNVAEREAEKRAFQLIMRKKEQLLSFEEPVSFIFAHSALREGWDNPNVFQICTLNQSVSERRKRQEIGRGLRLAVNTNGERIFDDEVNVLTVVANESYQNYVAGLQDEYVAEGHAKQPPAPTNARRAAVRRNDAIFKHPEFEAFWRRLAAVTRYRININRDVLIEECVVRLSRAVFPQPRIVIESGGFVQTEFTLSLLEVKMDRARLRVQVTDTDNRQRTYEEWFQKGVDLAKELREPRLKGFSTDVIKLNPEPMVIFSNREELTVGGRPCVFQSEWGQQPRRTTAPTTTASQPVFNLIDRAARTTGLTRPTINEIFKRMPSEKKAKIFANPEGFAGVFIGEITTALADHVVERLEFELTNEQAALDLEQLFPRQAEFPQRELVDADGESLYTSVQTDSNVERHFVETRLVPDRDIVAYFKFPARFRIDFPRIIGDYNPDWGVIRRTDEGRMFLHLVRETKGGDDPKRLRFPHERRKIEAAKRHFDAIGIDYRHVSDKTEDWWQPGPDQFELDLGAEGDE